MADLINEILFLSKMEAAEPVFEDVDISAIIAEAADNFRLMAKEKNVNIICETKTASIVSADIKLIERLISIFFQMG